MSPEGGAYLGSQQLFHLIMRWISDMPSKTV